MKAPLVLSAPIAHHPKNPRKMIVVPNEADRARLAARPALTRVEQGRNTPNHPTYQHDPKFQLVTAVENLDAPPPLAQARPTVHAEIAKAVQVDQAGATRLRRRFRQDEV